MGWIFSAAARQGSFEPPFSFRLGEKKMGGAFPHRKAVQSASRIASCGKIKSYPHFHVENMWKTFRPAL